MEGRPHFGTNPPQRPSATPGERGRPRPYQKPRIERHVASALILGNVSGQPDGLSGGERANKP